MTSERILPYYHAIDAHKLLPRYVLRSIAIDQSMQSAPHVASQSSILPVQNAKQDRTVALLPDMFYPE